MIINLRHFVKAPQQYLLSFQMYFFSSTFAEHSSFFIIFDRRPVETHRFINHEVWLIKPLVQFDLWHMSSIAAAQLPAHPAPIVTWLQLSQESFLHLSHTNISPGHHCTMDYFHSAMKNVSLLLQPADIRRQKHGHNSDVVNTGEEHDQYLTRGQEKIQRAGLACNFSKCEWAQQETKCLGFQLEQGQVHL